MSFSSKGKKYPIGSWLFGLHFLLLGIIQAYFQETNLENSFAWLAGNISILLFGTILGFVSFKTDINCDYEPYKEGLFDFIVKKKYWWIWLFIFQILNCFVFQDIGNPNYYTAFMMQLFTSISGIEEKYSIYQQIGISNTLMCAIYVLTAPLRRLLRIEKMLYNDGKSWEEIEE